MPLLADHFGRRMAVELDWTNWPGFSARAVAEFEAYNWPGNVRELRNVVERAVYRWEDPERQIDAIQFDPFHSPWAPTAVEARHVPPVEQDAWIGSCGRAGCGRSARYDERLPGGRYRI